MLATNITNKFVSTLLISLGLPVQNLDLDKKIRAANSILQNEKALKKITHSNSFVTNGWKP